MGGSEPDVNRIGGFSAGAVCTKASSQRTHKALKNSA